MYKVINKDTQEIIGFVQNPKYIFYDNNTKTIIPMKDKSMAHGIAINSIPYNITKEEKIPNASFVYLIQIDEGEYIFKDHNQIVKSVEEINTMQQVILEQDNYISVTAEALMDLDNQTLKGIRIEE